MKQLLRLEGGPVPNFNDFRSPFPLGIDRYPAPDSGGPPSLDRFDLLDGQPDLFAPDGEGAFANREDIHDLAVGPSGPREAAAQLGPLPAGERAPAFGSLHHFRKSDHPSNIECDCDTKPIDPAGNPERFRGSA